MTGDSLGVVPLYYTARKRDGLFVDAKESYFSLREKGRMRG
jgi:hypothetical protein